MKLLTIILLLFSLTAFAKNFKFDKETGQAVPNYVAELKILRGEVSKVASGIRSTGVQVGSRFNVGDTIITDDKSFAKIMMVDDTTLTLSANTEFTFVKFDYESKSSRSSIISLVKGQMRSLVKHKNKEGDLIYKTKHAAMAVRGTELLVNHKTVSAIEISEFALISGSAEVSDSDSKKHQLSKSDRIIVAKDFATEKTGFEKNKLSPQEYDFVTPDDSFLPYFEKDQLDTSSSVYPFFNRTASTSIQSPDQTEADLEKEDDAEGKKNWKNNLNKLNDQLKKNQERKSPFQ